MGWKGGWGGGRIGAAGNWADGKKRGKDMNENNLLARKAKSFEESRQINQCEATSRHHFSGARKMTIGEQELNDSRIKNQVRVVR